LLIDLSLACVDLFIILSSPEKAGNPETNAARISRQRSKARVARIDATPEQQELLERVELTKLLKKTQNELLEVRIAFEAEKQKSILLRAQCDALTARLDEHSVELHDLRGEVTVFRQGLSQHDLEELEQLQCPPMLSDEDYNDEDNDHEQKCNKEARAKGEDRPLEEDHRSTQETAGKTTAQVDKVEKTTAQVERAEKTEKAAIDNHESTQSAADEQAGALSLVARLQEASGLVQRIRAEDERICGELSRFTATGISGSLSGSGSLNSDGDTPEPTSSSSSSSSTAITATVATPATTSTSSTSSASTVRSTLPTTVGLPSATNTVIETHQLLVQRAQ